MATDREAHYLLDEILGNQADLPITEHATDTAGVSLVNFALFDLLGLQLSPRIRDLGKITLYRAGRKADFVAWAQLERQTLAERVQAGMDRARAEGKHVGRPPRTRPVSEHRLWAQVIAGLDAGHLTVPKLRSGFG